MDIPLHVDLPVRIVGQVVEWRHRSCAVGDDRAVDADPRQAADALDRALALQRGEELEQRQLALGADDEVDEAEASTVSACCVGK